jgi:hypothetical protein
MLLSNQLNGPLSVSIAETVPRRVLNTQKKATDVVAWKRRAGGASDVDWDETRCRYLSFVCNQCTLKPLSAYPPAE